MNTTQRHLKPIVKLALWAFTMLLLIGLFKWRAQLLPTDATSSFPAFTQPASPTAPTAAQVKATLKRQWRRQLAKPRSARSASRFIPSVITSRWP
ncbi:hypothetical protein [Lacticaseibacillus sp. N501-2]|uniref:hypothetical protein n=1 Tax=Lacticaseibacillus salsurae TaxID=3367729 RepID=UPI0038B3830B